MLGIVKVKCMGQYAPPDTEFSPYWKHTTCPQCLVLRQEYLAHGS